MCIFNKCASAGPAQYIFDSGMCFDAYRNVFCLKRSSPHSHIPYGLVARISGFHPEGPGSIPGMGRILFRFLLWFQLKTNIIDTFLHVIAAV